VLGQNKERESPLRLREILPVASKRPEKKAPRKKGGKNERAKECKEKQNPPRIQKRELVNH